MSTPIKNSGTIDSKSRHFYSNSYTAFRTSGFFDWYANWQQISGIFKVSILSRANFNFQKEFPVESYGNCSHLMVGCGNSKMSEEMAADGYPLVTNMDISPAVLHKMAEHYKS